MKKVFKYGLPLAGLFRVPLPRDPKVVHIHEQHGGLAMWVEVDPVKAKLVYDFEVVLTGEEVPVGGIHVGTAVMDGGHYVAHVYQIN